MISLISALTKENSELSSKGSHIDTIANKPEICILGAFPSNTGVKKHTTWIHIQKKIIKNIECDMKNEKEWA